MWDVIISNLPTFILTILAGIICGAEVIKAIKVWRTAHQERVDARHLEEAQENELKSTLLEILTSLSDIKQGLANLETRVASAETRLEDLTESDMNDIRAWIVEQYHKFYNHQGWIDAFSADTIDRRHRDYKKEGGNSYIDELVRRLHRLPMDPENHETDPAAAADREER